MSGDDAKYAAMREELSKPFAYSHVIGNADVLEPEPAPEHDAYAEIEADETIWTFLDESELRADDIYEPYELDGERGYLRRRREQ